MSFGIKKYSPYKRFFVKTIDEIRESGQMQIYNARNSLKQLGCKSKTEGNSLGFLKLASLFLVFFLGPLLSFMVLIYEYSYIPRKLSPYQKVTEITKNFENTMDATKPLLNGMPLEYKAKYFKIQEIIQEMKTEASTANTNENEDR